MCRLNCENNCVGEIFVMKLKSTFKQFDCCFFDVLSWINFCELWNTFLISSDNSHVRAPEQKVTWLFDSLNRISNNHEVSVSRQNRCLVLHCGLIEFMMVKSAINVFVNTRASRLTGHLIDHSEVRSSIRGRFSGWPGMLTYPKVSTSISMSAILYQAYGMNWRHGTLGTYWLSLL